MTNRTIALVVAAILPWIAVGCEVQAQVATSTKSAAPVAVDPWPVTADDQAAALKTFTLGGASLEGKLAAVIKADRDQLRKKLGDAANPNPTPTNPTPQPPSPAWLELPMIDMNPDGTPVVGPITRTQIVDTSRFTAVEIPIGDAGSIAFYDTGFVVLRTPKTEAVEKAVRERFGMVKAVVNSIK